MIRIYITRYLKGHQVGGVASETLPQVPATGDTFHFDDRAWNVDHVSWTKAAPGDYFGETGQWHAKIAVSA